MSWRWAWGVAMALVCCSLANAREAQWQSAWVSWVLDGDTVQVLLAGQHDAIKLRLEGIDAPEVCQPGGAASRDALIALALRQSVQVDLLAEDVYGRQVARIRRGNLDLGAEMVRTGMAWAYRYRVGSGPYAKLQKLAQQENRGLFAASDTAMAPPVFRKFHGPCHGP